MPTLQLKRATVAQNDNYIGDEGEIVVLTDDNYRAVVHDGVTSGGVPLALESELGGGGATTSLISQYSFEQDVTDSAGSNDGTNNGGTFSTDSVEGTYAINFGGTDSVDLSSNTLSTFSVAFDLKPSTFTGTDSNWAIPLGEKNVGPNFVAYKSDTDQFRFRSNDDTDVDVSATTSITTGSYYHVVFAYDGSELEVFVDGTSQGTASASSKQFTYDAIGDAFNSDDFRYDGLLDDLRIYDKRLTSTEASNLYTDGSI